MHHSLEVPEILCLIFKSDLPQSDLFNCALVCRLWGTWAQDVLWSTFRVPLQQLVQVLASVKKTRITRDSESVLYLEIGHIEEPGWRRFLALSNKITQIIVDCGLTETSLERIELARQTFNGVPFGQLQTLKMGIDDGQHETIRLMTVSSLTSVYLRCTYFQDDSMAWVVDNLPSLVPNVAHFGTGWITKLDVSQYSALKHIEIYDQPVQPRLWESLGSCQLLEKIVLTGCMDVAEWPETWRMDYVHFPVLRVVKIRLGHPRLTLKLMSRSRMPMLECLRWDAWTGPGNHIVYDGIVPHLKTFSPKLDIDMLYDSSNLTEDEEWMADSDDDCW
ncbi:hypothetical protein FRC05_005229 [Tulasnella sp. 425]|nr:hypothetical protein FRC05_005229 [Tulasnella sp. 425]